MFQITKAFRNGESVGREHNPEFTILEYYTIDADYEESLTLTEELLAAVAATTVPAQQGARAAITPITRLTVAEAFSRFASLDLEAALTPAGLRAALVERGMSYDESDDLEALFNRMFVHLVEPELGRLPGVALFDYPHAIPTTAKRKPGTPWSERWELYLGGVEVANCYSEETQAAEVDAFFEHEATAKREALEPHPVDDGYRRMFRRGFPRCSGVALGVDRLVQAILGLESIEGVILFPLSSIFR
jgi:lysyl-tRNA synthetase class 2